MTSTMTPNCGNDAPVVRRDTLRSSLLGSQNPSDTQAAQRGNVQPQAARAERFK